METRSSSNYIWNLKSVLGQGATGAVYTGRHKKSGDVVAVKTSNHLGMMRPLEVRKREFDVLSKLDHENIVKIFASETELRSQNEIIVMELCSGGSLFTMLEHPSNAYGLSEQDCIAVIRDVVAGMKHLHDNGIVHRDLKPGNIMRVYRDDGSCVYKLTDFGAARELMESDQFVSIYGTEEYLHPDLYERGVLRKATGKTFGAQVDLWSIGVTFYHIATGRLPFRPFGGRQNKDTMYHITTRKASGMIAGVQKSEGGEVEWTDKLPDHTCLSQGFRNLLTPLLAGVLESDPAKMMSFDQFFAYVQDMVSRKVLDVYCVSSSQFHKIYIRRTEMLNRFKQMVTEQTSVPCDQQELFYEFQYFQPPDMCPAADFPNTSRDRPVIMIGGEQLAPDKLVNLAIPKITELPPEWTLEGDAAVSKIMANCAYSCEHSVAVYSDSVKAMTDMIHTLGGTSSTNKMMAFRTIYSELHELRTLAAGAKVIALTATATLPTKETITDVLRMQDVIEINENPNKENITYIVKYLSNSMDAKESFEWLVNEINERKDGGDKTIIYCQTIKQCSLVYGTLRSMLIELVANGKPKLEMLHSCTPKENKDAILESFKRLDGHVQVLVATIAFGMGIDCKGVHRTIHFGPSKNCEAFIQETGRAGRDWKSSFSYLLYKGIMLNHVERDIKEYVKATTCRRQMLMKHFSKNHIVFSGDLHACCDNCAKACECVSENCESYTDFMVTETGIASEEKRRSVSEDQKKELSGLLKKYHKKLLMDLVRKSAHDMVQSLISMNTLLGFGETQIDLVLETVKLYFLLSMSQIRLKYGTSVMQEK